MKQEKIITINEVADILKRRKISGEHPFILLLGTCTSLRSSAADMTETVEILLIDKSIHIDTINKMNDYERLKMFYELMGNETKQSRYDWFYAIFKDSSPSSGYAALTSLLNKSYFDIILSLEVDSVLEESIKKNANLKYNDYKTFVRKQESDKFICKNIDNKNPKIKVLKLHGQVFSRTSYLGNSETFGFSNPMRNEIRRIFQNRDVLFLCDHYITNDLRTCFHKNNRTIIFVHSDFRSEWFVKSIFPAYENIKILKGLDAEFDRFFIQLDELLN